jgi:transcription antitermination factor NusG
MGVHNRKWPWFAIRVRSATEKTVNLHLENAGYESFLPLAKCTHRWSEGTEELEVPLFPGYIFCRMNPHYRLPILQAPGVIQIFGVGEEPIAADEEEIAAIQRVAKSGLASMPWPYLRAGHVARIAEGPLKGLTGIVVNLKSGTKLVFSVNLLQQSVAVEIDRRWIGDAVTSKPAVHRPQRGTPTPVPVDAGRLGVAVTAAIKAAEAG